MSNGNKQIDWRLGVLSNKRSTSNVLTQRKEEEEVNK